MLFPCIKIINDIKISNQNIFPFNLLLDKNNFFHKKLKF